jgi:hypothetical protein
MSTTSTDRKPDDRAPAADQPARSASSAWFRDIGWRMALAVAAAIVAGLSAPTWLSTLLTVAASVVVVERVVRLRRRGMLDAALVGSGMLVVVLGLLGLLLNYVPGGIGRTSWSIGAVLLAILLLTIVGLGEDVPLSPFQPLWSRSSLPTAIWGVAAAAILVFAIVISTQSFQRTHVAPLDLASTPVRDGVATLTVSSGSEQGPFEVDLVTSTSRVVLAKNVTVSAGVSSALVIAVPARTRALVQLVQPGTTVVLRQLIFDTTATASAVPSTGATG